MPKRFEFSNRANAGHMHDVFKSAASIPPDDVLGIPIGEAMSVNAKEPLIQMSGQAKVHLGVLVMSGAALAVETIQRIRSER